MSEYTTRKSRAHNNSLFEERSIIASRQVDNPSVQELWKMISSLQQMYKDEKEKRELIEEKFINFRERGIQREKQFYKIVEKLSIEKKQFTNTNDELERLYHQILNNFDLSNAKTNSYLQEKYKNLEQTMGRRIETIITNSAKAIHRNYILSKQSTQEIKKELKEILQLAQTIEQDNSETYKTMNKLAFENKMLKEEKQLLIEENYTKKKMILELTKTLKENSIRQDSIIERSETNQGSKTQTRITLGKARNLRQKKVIKNSVSKCPQIELQCTEDVESYCIAKRTKSGLSTPRNNTNIFSTPTNKGMPNFNKNFENGRVKHKSVQSQHTKSNFILEPDNSDSICPQCHKKLELAKKQNSQLPNSTLYSLKKTITHLQNVIKREKQKSNVIGNQMTRMISQSKEINEALGEIFLANREKSSDQQLKTLLQSQKMLETIRSLKRRLSILENPTVGCGWGQTLTDS